MMHNMVLEFHTVFGALVGGQHPELPDHKTREMRKKILEEEFVEYYDAVAIKDGIEMADALADISYVTCGTAISYGLTPHPELSYQYFPAFPFDGTTAATIVTDLRKALADYMFAEALNDLVLIDESLCNILSVAFRAADYHKIPLQEIFNEVHRSNMSKLDENGKPIFREDGKILKSKLYTPPDIKKILGDNWVVDGF